MKGNTRVANELQSLLSNPLPGIVVRMQELNEWHFVMRGPKDSAFYNGKYHGTINFPELYPQLEPSIRFTSPNGRYIPYTDLCLYGHDWLPSYTIRNVLTSLRFHMASGGIIGEGIISSPDFSKIEELATRSLEDECPICQKISEINFSDEDEEKAQGEPLNTDKSLLTKNNEEFEQNQESRKIPEESEKMWEWWYLYRATFIEELQIEIEQVSNSRSIFNITKIRMLIGMYLYLYSIKTTFHPIIAIIFRIISILFFIGCIVWMIFMIAEKDKGNTTKRGVPPYSKFYKIISLVCIPLM